jgi:predicted MFS family arabinose efflux permease
MLAVVAFLSTTDRQAFAVLLVPIQRELQVGDGAMGFLMGSAFALAQAIFMIPLARIADRANRRTLLAVAVAIWSLATALSGLAGAFVLLLIARFVVGAAEAAQTPVTASIMVDLFGPNHRGTAFMTCSVGTALGVAFGTYAAGTLNDLYDWHTALIAIGVPGLLFAALLYLTVPEPARTGAGETGAAPTMTVIEQFRTCLRIPTMLPFIIGFTALQGAIMGWFVWFPVYLMRVHGLSAAEMGAIFGGVILCGVLSAAWAGPVSDLLARRGPRWRLYFLVATAILSIPLLFASSLMPTVLGAQICAIGFTLLAGGHHPVVTATYASLSPPTMRAFVAALVYLSATLLGSAGAPILFGLVNDSLNPAYGDQAVRYTLLLAPLLVAVASLFFWIASRTVDDDMRAAGQAPVSI